MQTAASTTKVRVTAESLMFATVLLLMIETFIFISLLVFSAALHLPARAQ